MVTPGKVKTKRSKKQVGGEEDKENTPGGTRMSGRVARVNYQEMSEGS